MVALSSGPRQGEASGLTWDRVDLDTDSLRRDVAHRVGELPYGSPSPPDTG